MCENLLELNPDDVTGDFEAISVDEKLTENSSWSAKYDLVIGTDLKNGQALRVSEKCRENSEKVIPFVLVRQYGLIGSLKIDIDENCVAE